MASGLHQYVLKCTSQYVFGSEDTDIVGVRQTRVYITAICVYIQVTYFYDPTQGCIQINFSGDGGNKIQHPKRFNIPKVIST